MNEISLRNCAVQMQSINQNQLCNDDSGSLKVNGLPAIVVESLHVQ